MSYDEQPDGDPHGECAAEIQKLERDIAALRMQVSPEFVDHYQALQEENAALNARVNDLILACGEANRNLFAAQFRVKLLRDTLVYHTDMTRPIQKTIDVLSVKDQIEHIEDLARDKERIDWLESNPRHAQILIDGVSTDCVFYGIS